MPVRTFLDGGVLLSAARSVSRDRERALRNTRRSEPDLSHQPFRAPRARSQGRLYKKRLEKAFYGAYFAAAEWIRDLDKIEAAAQTEAAKSGLAAMDALHLAAAYLLRADEFITTERPEKPTHRSVLVKVAYLFQ